MPRMYFLVRRQPLRLSTSADFMYASAPIGPSHPSNATSFFPPHNHYGTFKLDLTSAYISQSAGNGSHGGMIIPPTVNATRPNSPNSDDGTSTQAIRRMVSSKL